MDYKDLIYFDRDAKNWYFWDESRSIRYGPYDTYEEVEEGLKKYVKILENEPR